VTNANVELARELAAIPRLLGAAARTALPPPDGEWSAREVVCHLIAVEGEAWHVRLDSLRDSADEPSWTWTEPGPWEGPGSETLETALLTFGTRRAATIERLTRLDDAGWRRTGLHPTFGRQDVSAVLRTALDHDREHIAGLGPRTPARD
jgi:hypothetical protein